MLSECMLILAVTIDIFIVALSCGSDCIKIPIKSAISIGLVGAIIMLISLYFSDMVCKYIPSKICSGICCAVLCAMGGMNIIRWILEKHKNYKVTKQKLIEDTLDSSILDVYVCGSCADCDNSKEISIKEAILVSFLMSVDTLVCGIVGGSNLNIWFVSVGTLVFQSVSVVIGSWIGRKCSKVPNISFIGGLILIFLGITKFI